MPVGKITIPARKFLRLFDYIARIGLDAEAIAVTVELKIERIAALDPEYALLAGVQGRRGANGATEAADSMGRRSW